MEQSKKKLKHRINDLKLYEIFKKMRNSNTILFLGAGASVGEKKYLSAQLIELYEQYLGKSLGEINITDWIDILSADPSFNRKHFDDFVFTLLQKLKVTEAHKILARIPWNEIITTNYDLLVEQAYDEMSTSSNKIYDLKTIRSLKQSNYKESNTEVKYIKLNGCMQDKSAYPFAFSSDDFSTLKAFYKNVLNELKNLSPHINFLSVGYSFSDAFGKSLLDKFDSYNFRDKRWMINVDPYPNENALPFYTKNKICIVKLSFEDFFLKYKEWEEKQDQAIVKKKGLSIVDSKNQYLTFPTKLLLNLEGIVHQLSVTSAQREHVIKELDYYKGEEPNFNVVIRGLDVKRTNLITEFKTKICKVLEENRSTLLPIFFIAGDFGIGKSTISLRLIFELGLDVEMDLVGFEIIDLDRLKKEFLIELILITKSKNVVFYCDEVEIDSHFKSLLNIQRELSIEQIQGCNIFFIVPIRENILEKFWINRSFLGAHILNFKGKFDEQEIIELLEKLKNVGLIAFRDASEMQSLVRKVQKEYESDSFISLMALITSGRHENDLIDSYHQLSKEAQNAFLFTALLHKHKMLMPASWLKQNISMSWEDFTNKIVKAEGKGILIQEERAIHGTQPDLFFRTKHPIIAEKLVDKFLPNRDKQFSFYERMLRSIEPGQTTSYLANNLLKGFIRNSDYNNLQINKLFEAGYTKLSDDPYFLLNYANNLQNRRTINDSKRALELLVYAESLLEYRNHKFIHRRGVISFELAKLYSETENNYSYVHYYLGEALDLFYTKQLMDPFSSYSYVDYIKLLIWEVENLDYEHEDIVQKQIHIEELFDFANRVVDDGIERIHNLSTLYANCLAKITSNSDYKQYLDEMYDDFNLKPYACILLFNHYYYYKDYSQCEKLVNQMEYYQENFEIIKFLFKYYGRRLYEPNTRIKLMKLSRNNPDLEKENPLRYNFFNFIAETYNYQFAEGRRYLFNIQTKGYSINPAFDEVWLDSEGNEVLFDGIIVKNDWDRYKAIKIPKMQQKVKLIKGDYDKYPQGSKVKVRLHFYLFGLLSEIIPTQRENSLIPE